MEWLLHRGGCDSPRGERLMRHTSSDPEQNQQLIVLHPRAAVDADLLQLWQDAPAVANWYLMSASEIMRHLAGARRTVRPSRS